MNDNDETPPECKLSPLLEKPSKFSLPPQQPESGDVPPNLDKDDEPETLVIEEKKEFLKITERRKIIPIKKNLKISSDLTAPKVYKSNKSNFLILIIAGIVGLLAIYVCNRQRPATSEPTPQLISYEAELKKMQSKYVNQTDRFWTTFLASHEPILTTNDPDVPAVIMLTIPESHHHMALCFAQHHAEILNNLLGIKNLKSLRPSYVDGTELSPLDPDTQKVRLDKAIQNIYEKNQRTVIINNLEKLHPESVRFFHGICDNLEAKYKDIAIIFILEVPEESKFTKDQDVYVYLYKLWSQLESGTINALLARMANNVAIMQTVDHFIC